MNNFDNFSVHPHRYFDSLTWEETTKPIATPNDDKFYSLLDGGIHIDGECRSCSYIFKDFDEDFHPSVEPFPGYIECMTHIELDANIAQAVAYLNKKGYETMWCCEGHMSKDSLMKGTHVEVGIGFGSTCIPDTAPDGYEFVRYDTGFWTLRKLVIPWNKYKCLTCNGNKCYHKGAIELTDEEYGRCIQQLKSSWSALENWAKNLKNQKISQVR